MGIRTIIGRSPEDFETFGYFGLGRVGLLYNPTIETLTDDIVEMDVVKPHIITISGKRGSGKSYTMGSIIEEVCVNKDVRDYVSCIIVDTMGVFHTMKSPNDNPQDVEILERLGLHPTGIDAKVYVPKGLELLLKSEFKDIATEQGYRLDYDRTFEIDLADISADDWREIFNLDQNEPMGILLERAVRRLRELHGNEYDFDDIMAVVSQLSKGGRTRTGAALLNRFEAARDWHIFGSKGLKTSEIIQSRSVVILDLSYLSHISTGWNVRALPVAVFARQIARKAMVYARLKDQHPEDENLRKESPIVWMFIDEGHQFLPSASITPATYPLIEWIRQGRHPGLSLVIATQMPRRLHSDVISLCDIAISHRITAKLDLDALKNIMQTYAEDLPSRVANLPKFRGAALVLDDNSEQLNIFRTRPRLSKHGGADASALMDMASPDNG